jgi:hypothetical protein
VLAQDAYSSMAPDPTLALVGGPCCPTLDFVYFFFVITITFNILLNSPIDINKYTQYKTELKMNINVLNH